MQLSTVIERTKTRVKQEGSQAAYQRKVHIDKTSLSLFLSGKLKYVPSPILADLGLKAETLTTYTKVPK